MQLIVCIMKGKVKILTSCSFWLDGRAGFLMVLRGEACQINLSQFIKAEAAWAYYQKCLRTNLNPLTARMWPLCSLSDHHPRLVQGENQDICHCKSSWPQGGQSFLHKLFINPLNWILVCVLEHPLPIQVSAEPLVSLFQDASVSNSMFIK